MTVTTTYEIQTFASVFIANGWEPGNQFGPEVTALANGGYAVVYGNPGGFTVPLVTFFDPNGVPYGNMGSYTVPYSGDSNDVNMIGTPEIITLANGTVAVIWDAGNGGAMDVVGAILDPLTGAVIVSEFVVSSFDIDRDPEATALANGNFVVAMTDDNSIYLQVMSPTGTRAGGQLLTGFFTDTDPVITALADGGFVVAYTVNDTTTPENAVFATIYNADSSVRTAPFEIGFNATDNDNRQPAVAALQNGNWAIVYADSGWIDDALTLQIFSPTGTNLTPGVFVRIDTTSAAIEVDPDITVLANGFIVVTWTYPFSPTDSDIWAQVFDQDGVAVPVNGSALPFAITDSLTDNTDASVAALLNGMFVTAWTDTAPDSDGNSIRAEVNGLVQVLTSDAASDALNGGVLRDRLVGNGGNDTLYGGVGDDTLYGGTENDTLYGGDGADDMEGGAGDDIYYVDDDPDVVIELAGDGSNDRVAANASFVLAAGADIERINTTSAAGTTAINLTGNALAQAIFGNAGVNTLSDGGGAGADTLAGAGGNDTYIVGNAGTQINEAAGQGANDQVLATVSFALAADDNIERLAAFDPLGGDPINLTGNALAQAITGNAGANTLHDGGVSAGGNDTLTGLSGNDTYRVFNAGTVIVESAGDLADRVTAAVSFRLAADDGIEIMTTNSSTATAAINLTGNALAQDITGNAGANVLGDGGGAGADTLRGLSGNDTYIIRNAGTQIVETAGRGTADRVSAAVSFTLAADDDIELMTTTAGVGTTAINLTGNGLAQSLFGNTGANRLDGMGGNDTLTGGDGPDSFLFTSALGAGNVDTIADFHVPSDAFELENAVFTGLSPGALTAGAFRANTTGLAGDASDRIIYETDTGNLFFDADGTGAGAGVRFAVVTPGLALTNFDFFVV